MISLWDNLSAAAGLTLSAQQHALLDRYLDLLLDANQRMNLTRIDDRAAAEVQHVGDALTVLSFLPREAHRLADVGSGGGVPGIPLAIARPDTQVVLIESTQKKAAFLLDAAKSLGLENVQVVADRAETVGRGNLRESFDVAVARALAAMDLLAEFCLPLVKIGGKVLAMKGPKVAEELPAAEGMIRTLGGGSAIVHPIRLPGAENHVVVEIPKLAHTDKRYPRPASQAKRAGHPGSAQ